MFGQKLEVCAYVWVCYLHVRHKLQTLQFPHQILEYNYEHPVTQYRLFKN